LGFARQFASAKLGTVSSPSTQLSCLVRIRWRLLESGHCHAR
jgi:hypothetical protein